MTRQLNKKDLDLRTWVFRCCLCPGFYGSVGSLSGVNVDTWIGDQRERLAFEISVDHSLKLIISKTGKLQHLLLGKASVCRFHESIIAAGYDALSSKHPLTSSASIKLCIITCATNLC